MRKLLLSLCLAALLAVPALAAGGMNVNDLRQIAQAGGSIIVDLDDRAYSVTELAAVAAALAHGATLTVKMDGKVRLSVTQCVQIAKARPGQVTFWFGD